MRVTIRDVAQRLNLSHTTISRVLNERDTINIPASTRERVRRVAQEMGYRPNQAARALATGRTYQIALWMRHIQSTYDALVIRSALAHIQQSGYQALVADTALATQTVGPGGREPNTPNLGGVDGYLVFEAMSAFTALQDRTVAKRPTTPVVGMGGAPYMLSEAHPEHDYVGVDLSAGAAMAIRHLIDIGCRRVAFLSPYKEARYEGYSAALKAAGLPEEVILAKGPSRGEARTALSGYIDEHGCPDGIFAFNDHTALGAYRALRDRGRRTPDDVALIGHDGIEDTEYTDCPLSTIVQPVEEMCRLAWQYLHRRIEDPSLPPQQILLRPNLVIRESSRRG